MSSKAVVVDWLAGASLGLLVGLLVGLSTSPVAAIVVGSLAALLGGVFGLAEKLPSGLVGSGARRLSAFALACVVALLGGVVMRTHHVLSPSAAQLRSQLVEIDITDPVEQKQMLRFLRFGLLPPGDQVTSKAGSSADLNFARGQGVLYRESTNFCADLRKMIRTESGPEDLLIHLGTGSVSVQKTVPAIRVLSPVEQINALRAAPLFLCEP